VVLTFDRATVREVAGRLQVQDQSGRGTHGRVRGAKLVDGMAGTALLFDGRDDYVALGNPEALQVTGGQTIVMWIRPDRLGARRNPYGKAYGGEGTLTLEPAGTIHYYFGTAGRDGSPYGGFLMTSAVKAGEWTHIAVVRDMDARKVRWYRDGEKTDEHGFEFASAKASRNYARIGRGYAGPFLGAIDEFAIFARALSEEEVRGVYELGRSGRSLK
jgi:hypothetical protein